MLKPLDATSDDRALIGLRRLCVDVQPVESLRYPPLPEFDTTTTESGQQDAGDLRARIAVQQKPYNPVLPDMFRVSVALRIRDGLTYKSPLNAVDLFEGYRRVPMDRWYYERTVLGLPEYKTTDVKVLSKLGHRLFGPQNNCMAVIEAIGARYKPIEKELQLTVMSVICLQYWFVANGTVYEREVVSELMPRFVFVSLKMLKLRPEEEINICKERPWTCLYEEATSHNFNEFMYRVLSHLKIPKAHKVCTDKMYKSRGTFATGRNFNLCDIVNVHSYLEMAEPLTAVASQQKYKKSNIYCWLRRDDEKYVKTGHRHIPEPWIHCWLSPKAPVFVCPVDSNSIDWSARSSFELILRIVQQIIRFTSKSFIDEVFAAIGFGTGRRLDFTFPTSVPAAKSGDGKDSSPAQVTESESKERVCALTAPHWLYSLRLGNPHSHSSTQSRHRVTGTRPVPPPPDWRYDHFGPFWWTPYKILQAFSEDRPVILRAGQKSDIKYMQTDARHYRLFAVLVADALAIAKQTAIQTTQSISSSSTATANPSTGLTFSRVSVTDIQAHRKSMDQSLWVADPLDTKSGGQVVAQSLTADDHQCLVSFLLARNAGKSMNLADAQDALSRIGRHENSIVFTLLSLWHRRRWPDQQAADCPSLSSLTTVTRRDQTMTPPRTPDEFQILKHLADFLRSWFNDVGQKRTIVRQAYERARQQIASVHKELGATLASKFDSRFGSDWNGYDCVQSAADIVRAGLTEPFLIRLIHSSKVFFGQPAATGEPKGDQTSDQKSDQKTGHQIAWIPIAKSADYSKQLAQFILAHFTGRTDLSTQMPDRFYAGCQYLSYETLRTIRLPTGTHEQRDMCQPMTLCGFYKWFVLSRLQPLFQPLMDYVKWFCPRPGPRFADGSYWRANPAWMWETNRFVTQMQASCNKSLSAKKTEPAILNGTFGNNMPQAVRVGWCMFALHQFQQKQPTSERDELIDATANIALETLRSAPELLKYGVTVTAPPSFPGLHAPEADLISSFSSSPASSSSSSPSSSSSSSSSSTSSANHRSTNKRGRSTDDDAPTGHLWSDLSESLVPPMAKRSKGKK